MIGGTVQRIGNVYFSGCGQKAVGAFGETSAQMRIPHQFIGAHEDDKSRQYRLQQFAAFFF